MQPRQARRSTVHQVTPRRGPRLAVLDGLRLIAALAVAGYHYTVAWRIDGVRLPQHFLPVTVHLSVYGFLGVELFFLISGFVIGMSSWGKGLGEFFVSRVSRLYPAYWAAVLITATTALVLPLGDRPGLAQVLTNLTMLQQPLGTPPIDAVYWTLFVELRFYLIMAFVLRRGLTYQRAVLLCAVWMTAAVIGPALNSPAVNFLVISDFAPYFIGGIALYLIHRFGPTPLLSGITGLAWLVSLSRVHVRIAAMNPGFAMPQWPGLLIITAFYAVLLLIALGHTDRISWRWLATAGALTYPFYLLHMRIGQALLRTAYRHTTIPIWLLVVSTLLVMLAVAWCVHRYVERPLAVALRAALRRGIAAIESSSVKTAENGAVEAHRDAAGRASLLRVSIPAARRSEGPAGGADLPSEARR